MGYRRLLKNYLQHVDQLLGSTLVETVSESELFTKRDLGELKNIAAEMTREKANRESATNMDVGAMLVEVIRGAGLTVEEVAYLTNVPTKTLNLWCYSDHNSGISPPTSTEFKQIVLAVLSWQVEKRALAANPQQSASPAQ